MSDSALGAQNTLLKKDDSAAGSGGSFVTVAEVNNLSGPNLSLGTEDASDLSNAWMSVVPTILDGGEVSFDLSFIPTEATHKAVGDYGMVKDMKSKTKRDFQLVFPDTGTTTWQFSAYVTGVQIQASHPGKLSAAVTLKITGQPTLS